MLTTQKIIAQDSRDTTKIIEDSSVALVVTSPPYPMISMWDQCFINQNADVWLLINGHLYEKAFESMHLVLDKVWEDVDRTVMSGGIVCINIGDATRNCNGQFKLFSNHTRIINKFLNMGYDVLPDIHWRKPTNAPNKFMGSGMYPPSAYVTYEHEYILIFRKGKPRKFTSDEKILRHKSAYFWEERNVWFSDLWELKGVAQKLSGASARSRSAAFPFELAYRLINMFSIKGDLIYDPFLGTGTVTKAAIATERNSFGIDIDEDICEQALNDAKIGLGKINLFIENRIQNHLEFIRTQPEDKRSKMYQNLNHNFLVKTKQETDILISLLTNINASGRTLECTYEKADA